MPDEYFDAGWLKVPKLSGEELAEAESRLLLDSDSLPADWQEHLATARANAKKAMAQELADAQAVVDSLSD